MSFQWIIDGAESISINRKKVVSQTQARDGTTRAVSRGGQVWSFDVRYPDGPRWSDLRADISKAEALDRVSTATISLSNANISWLSGYQGNASDPTAFTAIWTKGATTIETSGGGTLSSGFRFRAGDFIQLGTSGKVYTVAADVAFNNPVVPLHRPILDNTQQTYTAIRVGQACVWTVICTQFPDWTISGRDQVSWGGNFTFAENLV
jgi:hypothetical protein